MIKVIGNIKNGKAQGIDNIVELTTGGPEFRHRIFELLMQVWDQERMPEEWEIGNNHHHHVLEGLGMFPVP
jgi:hypothetical protein